MSKISSIKSQNFQFFFIGDKNFRRAPHPENFAILILSVTDAFVGAYGPCPSRSGSWAPCWANPGATPVHVADFLQ